jgi:hypothetical protein
MLRRVALVRTDVSQEISTFIIRVTRIGKLEITLAVTQPTHAAAFFIVTAVETSNLTEQSL